MKQFYTLTKNYFFVLIAFAFFTNGISAQTTTWDGSAWSNGTPDNTKDTFFTGNYSSSANIATKSVSVSSPAQVIINTGHMLTVVNDITVAGGSNLIFENSASLLQINALATNTGSINFKRNATPMVQYDYTYWSSPVAGQTLVGFSPLTLSDKFFSFDGTTTDTWTNENGGNVMQSGKGYAIRAPQGYNATPQTFNGEFIGVPNNGDVIMPIVAYDPGVLNYNLIGNPYPSAISVTTLIDNTTLGALYFWTHNTAVSNNIFTENDYAIRNKFFGTQAISGGPIPGSYVAAGQGFFASSSATGTITFTNTMRVADNNSQFYRNAQSTQADSQSYSFSLNMIHTQTSGIFKQLTIGYLEGATNGLDFGADANAPAGAISFYSVINNVGYAIQSRAYPWIVNDQIQLGFNTSIDGPFQIALDNIAPFFDAQNIYIQDVQQNVYHNLKTAPYVFNTVSGTFNNRFMIHYIDPNLSLEDYLSNQNAVTVTVNNSEIKTISSLENIKNIQVYDLLGKLIFEKNDIGQNQFTISNLTATNQALIIKTQLENNQTIVKKLVY
jgi:hypothetical protein